MAYPAGNSYQTYQTKAIFVSSGAYDSDQFNLSGLNQLSRVTSMNYSFNYPLADNSYIDLGMEPAYATPTSVDVTLEWWQTNPLNLMYLGMARQVGGALSFNLMEEKNLYVTIEDTLGLDAIGAPVDSSKKTIGFGQGQITSYQLSAQVGGLINNQATINYLTSYIYTGFSGLRVPAVDYQNGTQLTGLFAVPPPSSQYDPNSSGYFNNVAAIGARDMILMFAAKDPFGVTYTGQEACYLQSFQFSINIPRQPIKPLGYVYPHTRGIIFPIQVDLVTEATVNRYQADALSRLACTNTGFAINVLVKQPCSNASLFGFYFTDMQIESQTFANSIGPLDTVSTKWRGWLRTPQQTFFSPFIQYLVNTSTTGAYGTTW